jgi:hypothetical protein
MLVCLLRPFFIVFFFRLVLIVFIDGIQNKLCFILCQDKAFEDKRNCQFLKELVKVIVLIANVYLSTCGSLSSVPRTLDEMFKKISSTY